MDRPLCDGGRSTRTTQEVELLRDLIAPTRRVGVAMGLGHLAPAGRAWSASICGGPILYATRSSRSSAAVRPLEAAGNGFTMRFAVAYSF